MSFVQAILRSHKILNFQEKALDPDKPNLVIEKVTKTENASTQENLTRFIINM